MPELAIQTRRLTKTYGKVRGVTNLDLTIRKGEVFGFLGPNGAGKSTTVNILMNFRHPTSGQALIFGQDSAREAAAIHRRVGYIPGELALYENLTGSQLVRFLGNLRGGLDASYVEQLAQRFDIELHRRIGTLSKGNKQKIGLLQAMAPKPDLLILDEPTSGLDPLMQREFYRYINEIKQGGTTVFMSSHVMSEVEHSCDRVGIIRDGQLISVEKLADLHERTLRHIEVRFKGKVPPRLFAGMPGVSEVRQEQTTAYATVQGSMDAVIKALAKHEVRNVISEPATLEELFFRDYQGADA